MHDIKDPVTERFSVLINSVFNSQNDAAARLGFTRSYLSSVYNGKKPVTAHLVEAICRCSPMVNIDWLYHGRGEMYFRPPQDAAYTEIPAPVHPVWVVEEPAHTLLLPGSPASNAVPVSDAEQVSRIITRLLDDVEDLKARVAEIEKKTPPPHGER